MAINFPSSPTEGQIFNASPGLSFIYGGGTWAQAPIKTALPRNYVINPSMMVSQQNGDASSAAAASGVYYPADQWAASWNTTGGSIYGLHTRPAADNSDCIGLGNNNAVDPASNAGTYVQLIQVLEAQRVADFGWGTALAKQGIFHFEFCGFTAHTYTVQIKGGATTYTFLASFAAQNFWQTYDIVVPPPPAGSGVWPSDNTFGIQVGIGLAAGTTYGGGAAGWQAGNKVTMAGTNNGIGVAGVGVYLSNVGFYLDPYLTGVPPPWQRSNIAEETRRCQRYWYRGFNFNGPVVAATQQRGTNRHPTLMRTTPGSSLVGAPRCYDSTVTPTITTTLNPAGNYLAADFHFITSGGMSVGKAGVNYWTGQDNYIAMDARM